jgi:hypothetical protein
MYYWDSLSLYLSFIFLLYLKEMCKVANDFKITSIWWRCLVTSMVFLYSQFRVIEPYETVII